MLLIRKTILLFAPAPKGGSTVLTGPSIWHRVHVRSARIVLDPSSIIVVVWRSTSIIYAHVTAFTDAVTNGDIKVICSSKLAAINCKSAMLTWGLARLITRLESSRTVVYVRFTST
jgi:hypothetical protein